MLPDSRTVLLFSLLVIGTVSGCRGDDAPAGPAPTAPTPAAPTPEETAARLAAEDAELAKAFADPLLADGFDYPVGNADGAGNYVAGNGKRYRGWYVATRFCEAYHLGIHNGEDWNGSGGGDTDLGQPVHSIASGRVLTVTAGPPFGNIVVIEHRYLENGILTTVFSQYDHLREVIVKEGDTLKRRQKIGTIGKGDSDQFPAHLHLEIRKANTRGFSPFFWPSSNGWDEKKIREHYEEPRTFIQSRRKLLHPATAARVLLVVKHRHQLHRFEKGKKVSTVEAAVSQIETGHKTAEGDLRTPEGEYRIIQASRGPFAEEGMMRFLGAAWLRLNYPNDRDARAAFAAKTVTAKERDSILTANSKGKIPPANTKLGGGIGIHGWAEGGWDPAGPRALTWGCVSLNEKDLLDLYAAAPVGTPVVIMP
ncbi:MAG: peptidoglycan DD-metalloendopeptidase family protein [Verrucomicrobia bacterium]|nr:peptidoglycan DD-metalloendopeptidase family protein [Verrucomicrobiota bacterium]